MNNVNGFKGFLIRVFEDTNSRTFWALNYFSATVIVASLFAILLESDPAIYEKYGGSLIFLEYVFATVFAIEYVAYVYLSKKKLSYIFSFYGIVDLLSFLPSYLAFGGLHFLQILRVVRLVRILRLIRLLKLTRLARNESKKIVTERDFLKLNLVIYFAAYILLTTAFSIILFHIEIGVPDTQIETIQDAIWSVMSAISTVGFGDTFPASFFGKIFLGFVMLVGIGFLSFAILIVGRAVQIFIFGIEIEKEWSAFYGSRDKLKESEKRLSEEGEKTVD